MIKELLSNLLNVINQLLDFGRSSHQVDFKFDWLSLRLKGIGAHQTAVIAVFKRVQRRRTAVLMTIRVDALSRAKFYLVMHYIISNNTNY